MGKHVEIVGWKCIVCMFLKSKIYFPDPNICRSFAYAHLSRGVSLQQKENKKRKGCLLRVLSNPDRRTDRHRERERERERERGSPEIKLQSPMFPQWQQKCPSSLVKK